MKSFYVTIISISLVFGSLSFAEPRFADEVGSVRVGDARLTTPIRMPCITWGGDMATFYANGGLKTKSGSIFAKQGLNIELYVQDDPYQQARDYMEGKTPFFRGTYRMCGIAAEFLGSNSRTKPYMIVQLTWSAGDHLVAKAEIKTIEDLKGKKIAIQKCGPHVGMVDDILATANLTWDDVEIIWLGELTGDPEDPKHPAGLLRRDKNVDDGAAAASCISPDMIGLTGGLENVPTRDAEGTVKGAHVIDSTAYRSYCISDVYLVRKDFWDRHSDVVTKFAAGLLKAQEEVTDLKKAYEARGSSQYLALCKMGNEIYNLDFPAESEDGSLGMLLDCTFVGHPGNVAFFTDKNNPHGFEVFLKKSLDLAVSRGYAKVRQGIFSSPVDWNSSAFNFLKKKEAVRGPRFKAEAVISEVEALMAGISDKDIVEPFTIQFDFDSTDFDPTPYHSEFDRVCDQVAQYGNAVIALRGHVDTYLVLGHFFAAGYSKGILKRTGTKGNYTWYLDGRALNLESPNEIGKIVEQIKSGRFDGHAKYRPREIMGLTENTSRKRAEIVMDAIIKYAKTQRNMTIDPTQIQAVGVGVREPIIPNPKEEKDQKANMRVEFRLIKSSAESRIGDFDFDF